VAASVEVRNLEHAYGANRVVRRLDFMLPAGRIGCLLGPSGCGKTTVLRCLAGFEPIEGGTIALSGRVVSEPGRLTPPEDRRIGMVFQDYALFPHLSVAGNVGFGFGRRPSAKDQARVSDMLKLVGLAGAGETYPHELSGGQQQRVALARALAPAPRVVLLDEPWSNVDPQLRAELRHEVASVLRPLDVTALLVTHDREEAFSLADRIALMRDGEIVQVGTSEELYFAPADRWSAAFLGEGNLVRGRAGSGSVETPIGVFSCNGEAGEVEVLVRPELVALAPHPQGTGEVVAREFRGHDVFYRVLVDGVEVVSQRPSNEVVPLGARVEVQLHDGRVAVLS